jgi:hypothetical protein
MSYLPVIDESSIAGPERRPPEIPTPADSDVRGQLHEITASSTSTTYAKALVAGYQHAPEDARPSLAEVVQLAA